MVTLFDSHSHLNFSVFKDIYPDIIADCLKKKIGIINVGSQINTSCQAVEIASQYPNDPIYASIGIHPNHLSGTEADEDEIKLKTSEEKFEADRYQKLIDEDKHNKIIAVGEIGLDYFYITENVRSKKMEKTPGEPKRLQRQGLVAQLDFAQKNNLPIILHARGSKNNPVDAYEDLLDILKLRIANYGLQVTGVIHCFSSTLEIAKKFLGLGFYLGFTGIITFKNKSVDELREVVKYVPLDRILVETDAPYLTPEPHRGEQNKPQFVEFVACKVAEIKNISYEEVSQQTTENVERLFSV